MRQDIICLKPLWIISISQSLKYQKLMQYKSSFQLYLKWHLKLQTFTWHQFCLSSKVFLANRRSQILAISFRTYKHVTKHFPDNYTINEENLFIIS